MHENKQIQISIKYIFVCLHWRNEKSICFASLISLFVLCFLLVCMTLLFSPGVEQLHLLLLR